MADVTVLDHPLITHKLTLMRDKNTTTAVFRQLIRETGMLLTYEATRHLPLVETTVETPIATTKGALLDGKKTVLVAILRAGIGLLDGMLQVVPNARVGHVGLYRDPDTLEAVRYYFKLPEHMEERDVVVIDPMLATGNTAVSALSMIKEAGPRSLSFACLLAAPEGIERVQEAHPEVPIVTCAVDDHLDDHAYIVPGLGDAGDRIFGTK